MKNPVRVDVADLVDLNALVARDHALRAYRPTAVAVVQRSPSPIASDLEFLFVKSVKGDYWRFPQGGIREGENVIDGLFRELEQETGIGSFIVTNCEFLLRSERTAPGKGLRSGFSAGKSFYYFSVRCAGLPRVKLNTVEVDKHDWIPVYESMARVESLRTRHRGKKADMIRALQKACGA